MNKPLPATKLSLADAFTRLSVERPFEVFFDRAGEISIELYAPVGEDRQRPHDRDEFYIIAAGAGVFVKEREEVRFGPGDLLFVPAHVPHHFEFFTPDFKTWVIFTGPARPAPSNA